jgi:hypothetical protein
LKRAFETIDWNILMQKLFCYGITENKEREREREKERERERERKRGRERKPNHGKI